jgi:hypothetical protein
MIQYSKGSSSIPLEPSQEAESLLVAKQPYNCDALAKSSTCTGSSITASLHLLEEAIDLIPYQEKEAFLEAKSRAQLCVQSKSQPMDLV